MADHHFTPGNDLIHATTALGFGWDDRIHAGEGDDTAYLGDGVTFVAGPGNDVVHGSGRSQYATWPSPQPVRIQLAEGWAEDGFGGRDTLRGVGTVHLTGQGGEVTGSAADETVFVLGGAVTLDLGAGHDTVHVWQRSRADYTIRQTGDLITLTSAEHRVVMRGVESLQFSDATITPQYVTTQVLLPVRELHRFEVTERSPGWWYAGVYSPPQLVNYSPAAAVTMDLGRDGDLDVVVPVTRGYRTGVDTRHAFIVFENDGGQLGHSAALTAQSPFVAGARRSDTLLLARSGTELLVTVAHDTAIETETRGDLPWRFGDLSLTSARPYEAVTSALVASTQTRAAQLSGRPTAVDAHSMAVGDVNGDGLDDVLVGDFGGVFALLQTASGPFERVATPLMGALNGWLDPGLPGATPGLLIDLALGDLNGDGLDDLVVGWGHATVRSRVFFNDRQTGFTADNSMALPASVYGASNSLHLKTWIEDFDGDGDRDLLVLHSRHEPYYGGTTLQLLVNDGRGRLSDETAARLGDPATQPDTFGERLQWTDLWQVIDLNRDGAPDLIGRHPGSGQPYYYLNDGRGRFTAAEVSDPGGGQALAWGDFDGDGLVEALVFDSRWADAQGSASVNTFALRELITLAPPEAARAYDLDGPAGMVARTLGAVFGPAAVGNAVYAGIGLQLVDGGLGYEGLLDLALDVALGARRSDESVVRTLYTNLTGQAPSPQETGHFVGLIASGQFSQAGLARLAADLPLNAANIDLVGLAQQGLDYLPAG